MRFAEEQTSESGRHFLKDALVVRLGVLILAVDKKGAEFDAQIIRRLDFLHITYILVDGWMDR